MTPSENFNPGLKPPSGIMADRQFPPDYIYKADPDEAEVQTAVLKEAAEEVEEEPDYVEMSLIQPQAVAQPNGGLNSRIVLTNYLNHYLHFHHHYCWYCDQMVFENYCIPIHAVTQSAHYAALYNLVHGHAMTKNFYGPALSPNQIDPLGHTSEEDEYVPFNKSEPRVPDLRWSVQKMNRSWFCSNGLRVLFLGPYPTDGNEYGDLLKAKFGCITISIVELISKYCGLHNFPMMATFLGADLDRFLVQKVVERLMFPDIRADGYVMFDFPRTVQQAILLDEELKNQQMPVDVVIKILSNHQYLRYYSSRVDSILMEAYIEPYLPNPLDNGCDAFLGHRKEIYDYYHQYNSLYTVCISKNCTQGPRKIYDSVVSAYQSKNAKKIARQQTGNQAEPSRSFQY